MKMERWLETVREMVLMFVVRKSLENVDLLSDVNFIVDQTNLKPVTSWVF